MEVRHLDTYIGVVDDIIYYNEENGYAIAVLEIEDDILSIKGVMPFLTYGNRIKVVGEMDDHAQYGPQLNVKHIEHMKPTDEDELYRYLASGVITGIGEATAKVLVETFGKEVLEIIQHSPEKLLDIPGIGPKKLEQIVLSYKEQYELRDFIIYFQNLNLTINMAMKIYKTLGYQALQMVERNPFVLAEEITGIGFKVADQIAENMGIDHHSPYRIKAGIHYILQKFANEGHTYMPEALLLKRVTAELKVLAEDVKIILKEGAINGDVFLEAPLSADEDAIDALEKPISPLSDEGEIRVYLPAYYQAEQRIAEKLYHLIHGVTPLKQLDFNSYIASFEEKKGILLGEKQKEAIENAIKSGVFVVTGGPGTGKTTIINAILEAYELKEKKLLLVAPTGRAAKRMTEATLREAKTIHRALEFQGELEFVRKYDNPLEADVIIVDEISMVDVILMHRLLDAIKLGSHLIIVGDADQLPSVGAGRVLDDIMSSGLVPFTRLDEIYRQAETSLITVNAHKINHGEMPLLNQHDKDFFFISRPKPQQILGEIRALIDGRLSDYYGLDPLVDIQILAPMKNSPTGVKALNQLLQDILNPSQDGKPEKQSGGQIFRVGDKVMQIKNNYNLEWVTSEGEEGKGVYNGDIGFITDIDLEERHLIVCYDGDKEVTYDFVGLEELTHAFAITIHKSQGSEFKAVIMPMGFVPPMLMSRNILYTAITRAKELVILVGDKRAMQEMVARNQEMKRYSGLGERLLKLKWMTGD
jgi:exodeoxyribonuclease V alpha subunit